MRRNRPGNPRVERRSGSPSDTAFVLSRAGIIPENIVYDAPRNRFLGGDLERDGMIGGPPFAVAADLIVKRGRSNLVVEDCHAAELRTAVRFA